MTDGGSKLLPLSSNCKSSFSIYHISVKLFPFMYCGLVSSINLFSSSFSSTSHHITLKAFVFFSLSHSSGYQNRSYQISINYLPTKDLLFFISNTPIIVQHFNQLPPLTSLSHGSSGRRCLRRRFFLGSYYHHWNHSWCKALQAAQSVCAIRP